MKVQHIMKTEIVTIPKNMNCIEAARMLLDRNISGAPVVDEDGNLIGIVSEKDLFRSFYPSYKEFYENPHHFYDFDNLENDASFSSEKKTVGEVMSPRLITASPNTHVFEIGARMVASGIHRVPVVSEGRLVGIVSRGDIYRAIMRAHLKNFT